MNDRTCIVTRESGDPDRMIRFVAGPDGAVVADLKRNLPGRGCWVTATRRMVDEAVRRKLFKRGLKTDAEAAADLGERVDMLLARSALGSLGLARKAGGLVMGAAKCEAAVRSGKAIAVLHAREGAEDGIRKIDQARRAVEYMGGPVIPAYKLFSGAELDLALGATNVIHAAVLGGDAGRAAMKRVVALDHYRDGPRTDARTAEAVKELE